MSKTKLILLLTFQLVLVSIGTSQNSDKKKTSKLFQSAVFYSPQNFDLVFNKRYKPRRLTQWQLVTIKSFIEAVSDSLGFSLTSKNINSGKIDTLKHKFQIVPATNSKGETIVWINAICDTNKDWRQRLLFVDDGGSCYYNYKINLKKKAIINLQVNGNG